MYAFLPAVEAVFTVLYFKMLLFALFSQINKYDDNEKKSP